VSLHGDPRELDRMASDIRRRGAAAAAVARLALPGIRAAQAEQIAGLRTPYGAPWAPTKNGAAPTADIAARVTLRAEGAAIVTETDAVAGYHHSGTARMPARPLLPSEGLGIPQTWQRALDAAADKAMGERGAR
jgi:hypothetical protein